MRKRHIATGAILSTLAGTAGMVSQESASAASTASPTVPRLIYSGWSGTATNPTANQSVTVAGQDGTNAWPVQVKDASGKALCDTYICNQFRYSPDGKHIVFQNGSDATPDQPRGGGIGVADADGSNARILALDTIGTFGSYWIGQIAWGADSSTIYFTAHTGNPDVHRIWQVNADGTGLKPMIASPATTLEDQPTVLNDGRVVYTEAGALMAFDPKTGQSSSFFNAGCSTQCEVSPDGTRLATWGPIPNAGGSMALFVRNLDGSGQPIQVSAGDAEDPVWSPDGTEIAYGVGTNEFSHLHVHVIGAAPGDDFDLTALMHQTGSGDAGWVPASVSAPGSTPTPKPTPNPTPTPTPTRTRTPTPTPAPPSGGNTASQATVHRIGGSDRYETARLVSQAQWKDGSTNAVVLARGDQAPDALAGVPLAAHVHGPLLLTDPTSMDKATSAEIARVTGGPSPDKTVYVLGGNSAVSPSIEARLRADGYHVVRYQGGDRFGTALAVASAFGRTSHVIVATGLDFPDALAAGPLGAVENAPIVLSNGAALDAATAGFVAAHGAIDPVGGFAQRAVATLDARGKAVNHSLAGGDRYLTAELVASAVAGVIRHAPSGVGIASGVKFPDALTGGAYAANAGMPLLITDPALLSDSARVRLSGWVNSLAAVTVFGGKAAVSDGVLNEVATAAHGKIQ